VTWSPPNFDPSLDKNTMSVGFVIRGDVGKQIIMGAKNAYRASLLIPMDL